MVAAHKDAARPRRPRAAAPPPLTEAQLDEVRRAVLAMSGTGARSVSKHGIVVYLDKELTLPQPSFRVRPVPISAQEGAPSAATARPDGDSSTSKQRRSRRRLQERLEQRAAAQVPKRPTPPQGGGIGPGGQLLRSQLRLRAGAPWPRARCRRAPPLRLRASRPRRSRCPRFRRHRATDRHSGLLGVGRRRRFRGRRWPRRPARGQTRVGLHFSLRRRGRLGMLLVRRLIPAARRRGRCRRRDGCSRTRAGAAARQGWGQGGFRC